jgi:phenylpropionate dioxygenase-like ring-hydroxylating dioxygenase large terminal subunit
MVLIRSRVPSMRKASPIMQSEATRTYLAEQISRHRDGFAMARYFYHSEGVYAVEQRELLFKSWLLAGHSSQISDPGDYLQFEIAGESVIICRDSSNTVHALLNVCRHRGARVCEDVAGNTRAFTCPYHGWVYDLNGALKNAREFRQLASDEYGLLRLRLVVFHGLIFVNFYADAADFEPELTLIEPSLNSFDLAHARVAACRTYPVEANWKLALENYLECYHCATAHRAYSRSHTLKAPDAEVAEINAAMLAHSAAKTGIPGLGVECYHAYDDSLTPGGGVDCSRYALYDGYATGSRDGNPLAPLMGGYKGYDGGAGDFQFGPLAFMLGYPDHCVLYRFTPRSFNHTDMTVIWLVREDAQEGRDYNLEDLTWLWDCTTREDEYIISRNAAGVASHFFKPGPYHPEKEALCIAFTRWYMQRLAAGL